jgi:chromosome segregation ATPase
MDAAAAAERLAQLLQQRMRDLEAETCRRLIDWEDEKQFSLSGESKDAVGSDLSLDGESRPARRSRNADNISLASLFHTLDGLDYELSSMEKWLERKASHIEPLTEDCRDIEDENNQLEQQWKSFEVLKNQMKQILDSLKLDPELEEVLANPGNVMVYESSGSGIDVKKSENGVQLIHRAGTALKDAMDQAEKGGALHLRAINEKVEEMSAKAQHFCSALALIVVTVMEQLAAEVVAASDHGKVSKTDTHAIIAKKIRDVSTTFA